MENKQSKYSPLNEYAHPLTQETLVQSTSIEDKQNMSSQAKGKEKVTQEKVIESEKKFYFTDQGMGEYKFENAMCIGQLPLSPKSYGKPS